MKKLMVILPTFNESQVIEAVINDLKQSLRGLPAINTEIVIVDDGSQDRTGDIISKIKNITILRHPFNCGLGGAIGTGLAYAKALQVDWAITFDADGQHSANDIKQVINILKAGEADIVIGTRDFNLMPLDRRIINTLSNLVTLLFFGILAPDSQSGFRGFNKAALNKIKIKTQRMEVSSELFGEIKKYSLRMASVPISVTYSRYSRQKGQKNSNAFNILLKLALRLFR